MQYWSAWVTSPTVAAVPITLWTKPDSASTPICAFMPKYYWFTFFV